MVKAIKYVTGYVDDHARALLNVIVKSDNGTTYNIGGDNEKLI